MCYSKPIREVTETKTVSQTPYWIESQIDRDRDQWTIQIFIGTTLIKFKSDARAGLNIMEGKMFNTLISRQKLVQSNIPPMNNSSGQLNCMGKF